MSDILWNDVAKTYDEQFHLLEYARSEYEKIVDSIMSLLKKKHQASADGKFEVAHTIIDGDGIGKKYFRSSIKADDLEWCSVIARMVVPWSANHTMSSKLHIAIEYTPQLGFLGLKNREFMLGLAKEISGWEPGIPSVELANISETEQWIYCKVIDLTVADISHIVSSYKNTIELSLEFARKCLDKAALIIKGRKALERAFTEISSMPKDGELVRTYPEESSKGLSTNWLEGRFAFVEFFFQNLPSIWFFVHPDNRCLMYSHKEKNNIAIEYVSKFAIPITTVMIDNSPSGVLLDKQALEALSEQEICSKVVNAFSLYRSLSSSD